MACEYTPHFLARIVEISRSLCSLGQYFCKSSLTAHSADLGLDASLQPLGTCD